MERIQQQVTRTFFCPTGKEIAQLSFLMLVLEKVISENKDMSIQVEKGKWVFSTQECKDIHQVLKDCGFESYGNIVQQESDNKPEKKEFKFSDIPVQDLREVVFNMDYDKYGYKLQLVKAARESCLRPSLRDAKELIDKMDTNNKNLILVCSGINNTPIANFIHRVVMMLTDAEAYETLSNLVITVTYVVGSGTHIRTFNGHQIM